MSAPTRFEILRLYKDLLRYGQHLKFTDKDYFKKRIVIEFKKNKTKDNSKDIEFQYNVSTLNLKLKIFFLSLS